MRKEHNILIGTAILVGLVSPNVAAHLTADSLHIGNTRVASDGTTDQCRGMTVQANGNCPMSTKVSGTYRGSANLYLVTGVCAPHPACMTPDPGRPCDLEQSTTGSNPLNEEVIGGDVSGVYGAGDVPDGFWDDGGIGMACHVANGALDSTTFTGWRHTRE